MEIYALVIKIFSKHAAALVFQKCFSHLNEEVNGGVLFCKAQPRKQLYVSFISLDS